MEYALAPDCAVKSCSVFQRSTEAIIVQNSRYLEYELLLWDFSTYILIKLFSTRITSHRICDGINGPSFAYAPYIKVLPDCLSVTH